MDERVEFSVNGQQRAFRVRGDETAVESIRDRLGLTGTKLVCETGFAGAASSYWTGSRPS